MAVAVLALAAVLGVLARPSPAEAAAPERTDLCEASRLTGARVRTSVTLHHEDRTYTRITTELSVDVPRAWPWAQDLLLGERSSRYVRAMACLTRSGPGQQRRWQEWRTGPPAVTARSGRVKVVDKAHSWVSTYRSHIDVGTWRIRAGADRWTVRLSPPAALADARWETITVDPGSPGADSASPRPTTGQGATALVWRPAAERESAAARKSAAQKKPKDAAQETKAAKTSRQGAAALPAVPDVRVSLEPPWQRSWAAQNDRLIAIGLNRLGGLLWVSTLSALLLVAARRCLRRPGNRTAEQSRTLRNLVVWAPVAVALEALIGVDDVVVRYTQRAGDGMPFAGQIIVGHGLALIVAALLFGFARPPVSVRIAAAALALPSTATVLWFEGMDLWWPARDLSPSYPVLAAFALLGCCGTALTLLGSVAALWRLADDGGLLPLSRRFPGTRRVLRLRVAGPAVGVATVVVALCFALMEERNWRRVSWLSDRADPVYGADHRGDFLSELAWSFPNGQDWLIVYGWLMTSAAVLAVLRVCGVRSSLSPLADRADRLLFLSFFPVAVGVASGYYVGVGILSPLLIPISMVTLYGAAELFARRAVLAQTFEHSGASLATAMGPAARGTLLSKARAYREIHAELRRLDQGLFGDLPPRRKDLERELSRLHDWPAGAGTGAVTGADRLPARVSVVDAALALGPGDTWWANGSRGARFAMTLGLPASALATWAWGVRGEAWQSTLSYYFGLPDLALTFVYWATTWAGAGFVLGALWRRLPGRRGTAKALPVALAFALPIAVDASLNNWFTHESNANLALYVLAMLFVLTVTGIALDIHTFQDERRYWQSRLGLLLSVYQMRYYSLQLAYLFAQILAMITIWQFFAEPDGAPPMDQTGDK
ncbi:DUF6185 family protein [Streptomyces lushanensis]|uniref:DUF6185 family protein n=1 Tax=Streptomyces lushanensis TaxID=1434255 RepID=UPI000832BDAF|nr:DUF6185 family protein [Streptomyces lushanensis]